LAYEPRKQGLEVEQQVSVQVKYGGVIAGEYFCDLLVNQRVIIELKTVKISTQFTRPNALIT
jgi:GxxExxY protein